jgi:putative tricarboxylic transport membrane protein
VAVRPSEPENTADEPADGEDASPPVAGTRAVEIGLYLVLLALAFVLAYDNWRSGMGWERDGPQSGYLPFYLCVILAGASLWGLGTVLRQTQRQVFVTRDRLRRVLQVFVPTLLFCVAMQWLGLYVASFLLIAGFMRFVGRIAWWKSLVTAAVFSGVMFGTFEIAFDVLMPKGPLEALFGR